MDLNRCSLGARCGVKFLISGFWFQTGGVGWGVFQPYWANNGTFGKLPIW